MWEKTYSSRPQKQDYKKKRIKAPPFISERIIQQIYRNLNIQMFIQKTKHTLTSKTNKKIQIATSLCLFFDQTISHDDAKHFPAKYICYSTRQTVYCLLRVILPKVIKLLKGLINTLTGADKSKGVQLAGELVYECPGDCLYLNRRVTRQVYFPVMSGFLSTTMTESPLRNIFEM